jgi:dCMP deaminase
MELAQFVAQWSKDPNRKVGAVVTKDNYVVGIGFNGFPRGIADTTARLNDKELKNLLMVHAEFNALSHAGRGDTMYVWPLLPCTRCMGEIIQAGIKRLVVMPPRKDSKWNQDLVLELAYEAGVELDTLEWSDL